MAALTPEQHSDAARMWLGQQASGDLAISAWTSTEFASALASKQRSRVLDAADRQGAWRQWRTLVTSLVTLPVEPSDLHRAETLVDAGRRGLRAGDALHLAIAERHGADVATLDRDLADAAHAIGLAAPAILPDI